MLRIESYVTPIILSYVDKYIKNLKPEDSQVSLWGGDAVFSNLDLRLDVLEEELALPFSFVNGHIHELRIHVPWTKLTSEPIVITINTIECILKLRDGGVENSECGSSSRSEAGGEDSTRQSSPEPSARKKSRRQDVEAPTSYVQNLMNKIVNNLSIVCKNLILKYVEDDIVLSVNVKTLEMRAVNNQWKPAFIDINVNNNVLRHLGVLTDLTVCLDKRNASGRIENYQEPLLYRCSLSLRVERHYSPTNANILVSCRYHLHSPLLHFSLSDTQLPMFARLVALVLALSDDKLENFSSRNSAAISKDGLFDDIRNSGHESMKENQPPVISTVSMPASAACPTTTELQDSAPAPVETELDKQVGWSAWAWSVGAALLPIYWEEEDEGCAEGECSEHEARLAGRIRRSVEFGFFVDAATWVFKVTEPVQDSGYFGPTRMRFKPFLRIVQRGSYASVILKSVSNTRVSVGIAEVLIEPISHQCVCGAWEGSSSEEETEASDRSPSPISSLNTSTASERLTKDPGPKKSQTLGLTSAPSVDIVNPRGTYYLVCGELTSGYLSGSLFEDTADDKHDAGRTEEDSDVAIVADDNRLLTESQLLHRTAAFGLNFVYCLQVPEDCSPDHLAKLFANLEYSNLPEQSACRIALGACELTVDSGCWHRLSALSCALETYEYPPYGGPCNAGAAAAPHEVVSQQDVSVLSGLKQLPSITILFTAKVPRLLLYPADHQMHSTRRSLNSRLRRRHQMSHRQERSCCPVLLLTARRLEVELLKPMYPRRLALTAAAVAAEQVQGGQELVTRARNSWTAKVSSLSAWLGDGEDFAVCILEQCSPTAKLIELLLPHLYSPASAPPLMQCSFNGSLVCGLSSAQILVVYRLFYCWSADERPPFFGDSALVDAFNQPYPVLSLKLHEMSASWMKNSSLISGSLSITSANVVLREATRVVKVSSTFTEECEDKLRNHAFISYIGRVAFITDEQICGKIICLLMSGPEGTSTFDQSGGFCEKPSHKLLQCAVQVPYDYETSEDPILLYFVMQKTSVLIDCSLLSAVMYCPLIFNTNNFDSNVRKRYFRNKSLKCQTSGGLGSDSETTGRRASSTATPSDTRSSRVLTSNVTSNSDRSWQKLVSSYCSLLQKMLLHIDIHSCTFFLPSSPLNISCETSLSDAVHRTYLTRGERRGLADTAMIVLPHVTVRNASAKSGLYCFSLQLPMKVPREFLATVGSLMPWSASLGEFSIWSLQGDGPHVRLPVLKPVTTTATISIATKAVSSPQCANVAKVGDKLKSHTEGRIRRSGVSTLAAVQSSAETDNKPTATSHNIVVHTDISPVHFCGCRRQVQAHVSLVEAYAHLAARLTYNYHTMTTLYPTSSMSGQHSIVTEPKNHPVAAPASKPAVTAWVQWTVAKFSATLYAKQNTTRLHQANENSTQECFADAESNNSSADARLQVELEDLTMAVDLQEVYTKIKCRVTAVSVLHYKRVNNSWMSGEHEGVVVLASSSDVLCSNIQVFNAEKGCIEPLSAPPPSLPTSAGGGSDETHTASARHGFLALTLTSAVCKSVHGKWNQLVSWELSKDRLSNASPEDNILTEVDMRVQPLDFVLSPVTLKPFTQVYEPWLDLKLPESVKNKEKTSRQQKLLQLGPASVSSYWSHAVNSRTLPLLYLHIEGVRVFLPSHHVHDACGHDVLLLQISSAVISPQVDNPIERMIERRDIWKVAEQARVLTLPGSMVEDRQYQLDLIGVALCSGSWCSVATPATGRPRSSSHDKSLLMGENPALEWNNFDPEEVRKFTHGPPVMHPVIAMFDTRITFAPAVVYCGDWLPDLSEGKGQGHKRSKCRDSPVMSSYMTGPTGHVTTQSVLKHSSLTLVAGHSLEVNIMTALVVYLSLPQLQQLTGVFEELASLFEIFTLHAKLAEEGKSGIQEVPDSGVDCDVSSLEMKIPTTNVLHHWIMTPSRLSNFTNMAKYDRCGCSDVSGKRSPRMKPIKHEPLEDSISEKKEPILSTASTCGSHSNIPIANKSSTSVSKDVFGSRLKLPNPEYAQYLAVPVQVLLTASKVSLTLYDKLVADFASVNKSVRTNHRGKAELRARRREAALLGTMSTESEPSPQRLPLFRGTSENRPGPVHSVKETNDESSFNEESPEHFLRTKQRDPSQGSFDVAPEDGYDGSEEGSVCGDAAAYPVNISTGTAKYRLLPLLHTSVSQPHAFFSCRDTTHKLEVSVFDFALKGVPVGHSVKYCNSKQVVGLDDFLVNFLETRPGDVHFRTGIPPSLLTIVCEDFLNKPGNIKVEIGRPVRFTFSEKKYKQIMAVFEVLSSKLNWTSPVENKILPPEAPNECDSTNWLLQLVIACVGSVSLSTAQLVLNYELHKSNGFTTEINCSTNGVNVGFSAVRRKTNVASHSQVTNVKHNAETPLSEVTGHMVVKELLLKTSYNSGPLLKLLKPWTFTGSARLHWMSWSERPFWSVTFDSKVITLNIGPEHIFCVLDLVNYFRQIFPKENTLPTSEKKQTFSKTDGSADIVYQDDLRAGVFQFFKDGSVKEPKPYEIAFDNEAGTMMWCYPEPRTLSRVDILPVPFVAASDTTTTDNTSQDILRCALQFYDPLRSDFITYREFDLSECELCQLELPSLYEINQVGVATTWRICIAYSDSDNSSSNGKRLLPPTALAACIRVDSVFSPSLLPEKQAYFAVDALEINFQIHTQLSGKKASPELAKFSLVEEVPAEHDFLTSQLNRLTLRCCSWPASISIEAKAILQASIINYSFLTDSRLLEPVTINTRGVLHESMSASKPRCVDVQIYCQPVFLYVSQSSLRSATVALSVWKQAFLIVSDVSRGPDEAMQLQLPAPRFSRYCLCNNSGQSLRIGQADTEECRLLQAGEALNYCWRSHMRPTLIRICRDTSRWRWSKPFSIDGESCFMTSSATSIASSPGNAQLVVRLTRTADNILVTFSSVLSFANCLHDSLDIKATTAELPYSGKSPADYFTVPPQNSIQCNLPGTHTVRFRLSVPQRLQGTCASLAWSEPVVIAPEAAKEDVLLKLSSKHKGDFVHVFCRVLRQRVSTVVRSVVVVSPQFVVKSHLPRPLILHLTTPSTRRTHQVVVPGCGGTESVRGCEASLSHFMTFQLRPELPQSSPPIPLHRGLVEQVRNAAPSTFSDLGKVCEELFHEPEAVWPYLGDENDLSSPMVCTDQPKVDLQIGFVQLHSLLSTVVVDVRPWALIINHSSADIVLHHGEPEDIDANFKKETDTSESMNNAWIIPNNAVFAPPKLDGLFRFAIVENTISYFSSSLQLSKEDRWYSLKFEGRLPRNGLTNITVQSLENIYYMTVVTRFSESIQIIQLLPTYAVANNTCLDLRLRMMSVLKGSCSGPVIPQGDLVPLPAHRGPVKQIPLLKWPMLVSPSHGDSSAERSPYVQFCNVSGNFGDPLSLSQLLFSEGEDLRMSFSLPTYRVAAPQTECSLGRCGAATRLGSSNTSLILTVHPFHGRYKLVLQEDDQPQFLIYNNTMATLLVGEGCGKKPGGVGATLCQELGLPLCSQHVVSSAQCWAFTSTLRNNSICSGLSPDNSFLLYIASCDSESPTGTSWSQGVDISSKFDQFENVPGFGDVKVHSERVGPVIHVFIDTASRVEVSAKDIRSRIAVPAQPKSIRAVISSFSKATVKSELYGNKSEEKPPVLQRTFSLGTSAGNTNSAKDSVRTDGGTRGRSIVGSTAADQINYSTTTTVLYSSVLSSQVTLVLLDDHDVSKDVREVLRITVDNVVLSVRPKLDMSDKLRALCYRVREQIEIRLLIGNAQIDNQLFAQGSYDFPVILMFQEQPNLPTFSNDRPMERLVQKTFNEAKIKSLLVLEKTPFNDYYIQKIELMFQPLKLYAEDVFFYSLIDILQSFTTAGPAILGSELRVSQKSDESQYVSMLPNEVLLRSLVLCQPVSILNFTISPLSVQLSVHASIKLYIALDKTPLHFSEYKRWQIVTTSYSLGQNVAKHYLSGALVRAGWVIGSLELIGNPGGFARTVGSGFKDFVQLPYEGILVGPWAFIAGITHGSLSLLKHLTAGTVVSLTNLAGSVARNMDRLSLDGDHMHRSERERRTSRPQGLLHGLVAGLTTFGISLLGGIGGLAQQPLEAVMNDNVTATGVVGGFGKGMIGVVTKPIGGAADLFLHTGQGLLKGTGWQQDLQPRCAAEPILRRNSRNNLSKLSCKMLAELPVECRRVLAHVDCSLISSSANITPITAVLTPQVLFVVCCNSDSQHYSLPLLEVKCRASGSDPTLLHILKLETSRHPLVVHPIEMISCLKRVREYVLGSITSNSTVHCLPGQILLPQAEIHSNDGEVQHHLNVDARSIENSVASTGRLPHVAHSEEAVLTPANDDEMLLRVESEEENVQATSPVATMNALNVEQEAVLGRPTIREISYSERKFQVEVQLLMSPDIRDGFLSSIVSAQRAMQGRGFIV